MIVSTALNLLFVPVIYVAIAALRTRLAGEPKPAASVIEPVLDVPVGAH